MAKKPFVGYGENSNAALKRHRKAQLPKLPHRTSSILSRGPRELQSSQLGPPEILSGPEANKPPTWTGSLEEWIVYWALEKLGKRESVDFQYQAARLGGRLELGGLVADFLVFPDLVINVQGVYWHYGRGAEKLALDRFQAVSLASRGYRFIAIDADQLDADPSGQAAIRLVSDALKGIDHSRFKRGL